MVIEYLVFQSSEILSAVFTEGYFYQPKAIYGLSTGKSNH